MHCSSLELSVPLLVWEFLGSVEQLSSQLAFEYCGTAAEDVERPSMVHG